MNNNIFTSATFQKLAHWCAQRERSSGEVLKKCAQLGYSKTLTKECLAKLIKENFVNDQRFASLFTRSKFNQNKWGRIKIRYHLQQMGIAKPIIEDALNEIDNDAYENLLKKLLIAKYKTLKGKDVKPVYSQLVAYGLSKGYENSLVIRTVSLLLKNKDY